MKVLFLLSIGLSNNATSEHLLEAIIEEICKNGHEVHILQKQLEKDQIEVPERLKSYSVTSSIIPFKTVPKGNFVKRYLAELKYVKACKKNIVTGYGAVFIQSTTVGGFAVKAVRKKLKNAIITFNVQDIFPYNAVYSGSIRNNSIVFKVLAALQRFGYKHADHIITISEDMKDTLAKDGTPDNKIKVIYNWSYQDEIYDRNTLDMTVPNQLFSKGYFNVVYAGNIGVMQNVDILIEVAALMKDHTDVWFHIIGDGAYKEKLQKKAENLCIENISFWPMQPPEAAPSIYASADVNIIPLVKDVYRTALPSKTATCLACGRPIIFAIGKESKFGEKISRIKGFSVTDCDNANEIKETIVAIQRKTPIQIDISSSWNQFKKTNNSRQYASIITKK